MDHPTDFYKFDSLKVIESQPQMGFSLGIITELKIGKYFRLRFIPDLAFAQRDLKYKFAGHDTIDRVKKTESTFLDFPLSLKLKSERAGNFGGYLIAGVKYTYDLASQKDVDSTPGKEIVKLKRSDYAYEAGGGMDFFLPYFKFAIELKASFGMKNILVNDNTIYSNSMAAKLQISLTFLFV